MNITQGCINLQLILQEVCSLPLRFTPGKVELNLECSFFNDAVKSRARKHWKVSKFFLAVLHVFAIFRIKLILPNWKDGNHAEQLCGYTLAIATSNIGLSSYNALEKYAGDFSFVLPQALKYACFRPLGYPSFVRLPSVLESLVYIVIGFLFAASTPCAFLTPFATRNHPLKVVTNWLIQNIPWHLEILLTIISSITYTSVIIQGAGTFAFLLLGCVSFCEAMQNVSYKLFNRGRRFRIYSARIITHLMWNLWAALSFTELWKS